MKFKNTLIIINVACRGEKYPKNNEKLLSVIKDLEKKGWIAFDSFRSRWI